MIKEGKRLKINGRDFFLCCVLIYFKNLALFIVSAKLRAGSGRMCVFWLGSRAKSLGKYRGCKRSYVETICAGEMAGKRPWFSYGGGLGLSYNNLFSVFLRK